MKSFPDCEKYKSDEKIVLKENKSTMIFLNPKKSQVLKIKVDGCAIADSETPRCDYALVTEGNIEIYVELKGSDIRRGVEQLRSTISLLSDDPGKLEKLCFLVSTRVPKTGTDIQKIKGQFKKDFNASFRIKNIKDTCDLSSF